MRRIVKAYACINMEKTGNNLKEIMNRNGHNGVTLSNVLECNPQAVYKWVGGKTLPSIDHLITFCKMFNVTVDDIISYNYVEEEVE